MRRLADQIAAFLGTWPPEEAQAFARSLRRFVEGGPFRGPLRGPAWQ
ncbi:hypothetical protein [Streptosporangium sp. NPDC000396]